MVLGLRNNAQSKKDNIHSELQAAEVGEEKQGNKIITDGDKCFEKMKSFLCLYLLLV